ncbi:hypothetical protein UY3_02681 [Chelonia mydas]|uniref:Secreted protein n=1 Tax=Chelonia mydas TaxID=8469 RepID=M7BSD7_CHEMY|nr:hypothetical protein UY3_02681 [Chelonia mydas]
MAPLWLLRAPIGAAGAVPVDGAACRATWSRLHVGAGEGTCRCFREPLETPYHGKHGVRSDRRSSYDCSKHHAHYPAVYAEPEPAKAGE